MVQLSVGCKQAKGFIRAKIGSELLLWESTFQGSKLSVVIEVIWNQNRERSMNLPPEFVYLPENYLESL